MFFVNRSTMILEEAGGGLLPRRGDGEREYGERERERERDE